MFATETTEGREKDSDKCQFANRILKAGGRAMHTAFPTGRMGNLLPMRILNARHRGPRGHRASRRACHARRFSPEGEWFPHRATKPRRPRANHQSSTINSKAAKGTSRFTHDASRKKACKWAVFSLPPPPGPATMATSEATRMKLRRKNLCPGRFSMVNGEEADPGGRM